MRKINLLDWRAELVKENKKEFLTLGLIAAILGAVAAFLVYQYFNRAIQYQVDRNTILETEIKILDKKIEEVKELESTKQRLLDRMNVIDDLQKSRPLIVKVFDDMARVIPEGTYLNGAQQNGNRLTFSGITESNTRVSLFMRNIDAATSLYNSDLGREGITNETIGPRRISKFVVVADIDPTAYKSESE